MTRCLRTVLVALCASACLPAQITIVDAANGPGTHFTDIQSAVDAALPNDRISVRPGLYDGFTVDGKPLAVNAEDGVLISTRNPDDEAITLRNLPVDTNTIIGNFWLAIPNGGGILVESSPGRALFDEILQLTRGNVTFTDCAQLLCNRSRFTLGTHTIERSKVILTGCTLRGRNEAVPTDALSIVDSEVTMSRCIAVGGSVPTGTNAPGAGVRLTNSELTLTGDGSGVIAAGNSNAGVGASPIQGDGTLTLDSDVVLRSTEGAPNTSGSVVTTNAEIPSLAASGTALGELANVDVFDKPGYVYVVLLSRIDNPTPIPALGGEMWLNLSQMIPAFGGLLDSTGRAVHPISIRTSEGLFGLPVAWIAATGPNLNVLRFSNNAGFTYWM